VGLLVLSPRRIARVLALAALAGASCYAPELRDCTIACSAATDCAAGQVCGPDRLCTAPEHAGTCGTWVLDAGPGGGGTDAGSTESPGDAAPPADAALPLVPLRLEIKGGKGKLDVLGVTTCDTEDPSGGKCEVMVPIGVPLTIVASPHGGFRFDRWETMPCSGLKVPTCTFAPTSAADVRVKVRRTGNDDDDDD
jgi:hypothetical protein